MGIGFRLHVPTSEKKKSQFINYTFLFAHPVQRSELVRAGLLTPRNEPSRWWIGVPGSTGFARTLIRGRTALLQMLRRSKHHELPRTEVICLFCLFFLVGVTTVGLE